MKWFEFHGLLSCSAESAVNAEGIAIDRLDGAVPEEVDRAYVRLHRCRRRKVGFVVPDMVWVPGGDVMVISDRARKVLDQVRIEIILIPATILSPDKRVILAENYWFGYQERRWEVLDLDKSDLQFFPDGPWQGKVLGVNKCVLDVRKIPGLDLFQMEPTGWVISEKLKRMLESEELTGMEFTCVADG